MEGRSDRPCNDAIVRASSYAGSAPHPRCGGSPVISAGASAAAPTASQSAFGTNVLCVICGLHGLICPCFPGYLCDDWLAVAVPSDLVDRRILNPSQLFQRVNYAVLAQGQGARRRPKPQRPTTRRASRQVSRGRLAIKSTPAKHGTGSACHRG
jgi:hypothetical protein